MCVDSMCRQCLVGIRVNDIKSMLKVKQLEFDCVSIKKLNRNDLFKG